LEEEVIVHSDKIICIKYNNSNLVFSKRQYHHYSGIITEAINNYNCCNPLSSSGIHKEQIRSFIKERKIYKDHKSNELALSLFLTQMEKEGIIVQNSNRWNMAGYKPVITNVQKESMKTIETLVLERGFEGIYEDELFEACIDHEWYAAILNRLMEAKTIYKSDRIVFHVNKISDAKAILYKFLTANVEGIKVSEFRELLGTNRTIAMIYLDILEEEKFIFREGDYRFLYG
jgi:hypothetical protein